MDNPSAFPNTGNSTWNLAPCEGMSLRDWFAGQSICGCAAMYVPDETNDETPDLATVAYAIADAMLKARNQDHA